MTSNAGPSRDEVWVVIDDRIGIQVQALGLAEALARPFAQKHLVPRPPWSWLPIRLPRPVSLLTEAGLKPPWPRLVIGCGRRMVPYLQIMRNAGSKIVFLGDPTIGAGIFDLIIVPAHDGLRGPNVVVTLGSMHRVTPARLAEARLEFAATFGDLPSPRIGVLLGGLSNHHKMPVATATKLAEQLRALALSGAGLMITPSRRTPRDSLEALRRIVEGPNTRVWDGNGPNPYFGILAHADLLIVTDDSVNMASEACATGKPVLTFPLPGRSRRISLFHRDLRRLGHTRPFTGTVDLFNPPILDEMGPVVRHVRELLADEADNPY